MEKVLEAEKRKDEMLAQERRLTRLDTFSRIATQYQGSFEVGGHEVKVRPASVVMCFSPATFNCLGCM